MRSFRTHYYYPYAIPPKPAYSGHADSPLRLLGKAIAGWFASQPRPIHVLAYMLALSAVTVSVTTGQFPWFLSIVALAIGMKALFPALGSQADRRA